MKCFVQCRGIFAISSSLSELSEAHISRIMKPIVGCEARVRGILLMPTYVTKLSGVIHGEVSGFDSRSCKNVTLL
jgi:hypothetical protein